MTVKEFDAKGKKIDKMWKRLWYEVIILGKIGDLKEEK